MIVNGTHTNREERLPTDFAADVGKDFLQTVDLVERKGRGQYFTPPSLARFMSKMGTLPPHRSVSILDPGAGSGILACALCEEIASNHLASHIDIDLYENDPRLSKALHKVMDYLKAYLSKFKISVEMNIYTEDYILANAGALSRTSDLFALNQSKAEYDIVITNPPYFKLAKDDPRALATAHIVHGQPNIYALFMAVSAAQLKQNGLGIYLTPRSYMSGSYFQTFRKYFFSTITPRHIHVFDSRDKAFSNDKILQENVVLLAERERSEGIGETDDSMKVSSSIGVEDAHRSQVHTFPLIHVLSSNSRGRILRAILNSEDEEIADLIDSWPDTFSSVGLRISTGPVVPFRAPEFLMDSSSPETVPLLWMHHVHPMQLEWPRGQCRKPQYILNIPNSQSLLIPKKNYVIARRFSAKEEKRRLVAAPLLASNFSEEKIGVENHLNYITRHSGQLSEAEAIGVAALINSQLLDRYFRLSSGNTQVNASEIRQMPFPPLEVLQRIGTLLRDIQDKEEIDRVIAETITTSTITSPRSHVES